MKELIRNDAPWEANVVEGPFVLRRGQWFYLFYSGNGCCGRECNYALGVARARALFGPWVKNPRNPILSENAAWKCPGHGSIVSDSQRRDFLLYHSYSANDSIYVGRQALLDQVNWGEDGWPTINDGKGPSRIAPSLLGGAGLNAERTFFDDFTSSGLKPDWQWPQANEPVVRIDRNGKGQLILAPTAEQARNPIGGAVLAIKTTVGNYFATTLVNARDLKTNVMAGLSAYGDGENTLGVAVGNGKVALWRWQKTGRQTLAALEAPAAAWLYLRMTATDGHRFRFAVSEDGSKWKNVGPDVDVEGNYLPPWDGGVRVALTCGGTNNAAAKFDWLRITPVN